jgi:hypothetical protein
MTNRREAEGLGKEEKMLGPTIYIPSGLAKLLIPLATSTKLQPGCVVPLRVAAI